MLDNKTKERIKLEAAFKADDGMAHWSPMKAYIAGAEAEATRAEEIIEAYRELCEISNDLLNKMEKHAKDYESDREKVARAYDLLKKIEALTNYNNPK